MKITPNYPKAPPPSSITLEVSYEELKVIAALFGRTAGNNLPYLYTRMMDLIQEHEPTFDSFEFLKKRGLILYPVT